MKPRRDKECIALSVVWISEAILLPLPDTGSDQADRLDARLETGGPQESVHWPDEGGGGICLH